MPMRLLRFVGLSLMIVGLGFESSGQGRDANRQPNKTSFKFDFGPGKVAPGHLQVLDDQIYTNERGYGFEPGTKISCQDRGEPNPLRGDFCTSDKPFFFSVALPEGNYLVTIDLHQMSTAFYEALGPEKSKLAFKDGDGTHHNNYGSYELAKCVVAGIRGSRLGIAKYLTLDTPAFDCGKPDALESFSLPPSPDIATAKPLGS